MYIIKKAIYGDEIIGVFSGECALGTGFLSSFGSDISDIFGTKSTRCYYVYKKLL